MIENFFKTAYRNLWKNKMFTALNVVGLALGMYLSLLFIALLTFLHRFDDFHQHRDRIYRVITQEHDRLENPEYATAPVGLAEPLKTDFTGVEKVVRIHRSLYGNATYGEKEIHLNGYFADPEFLEVFNFPLLEGDKNTALTNPNSIIITETEAKKIFGKKDAMGEIIRMEGYGDFLVTGILKDLPDNTHMLFEAVASYATLVSVKGSSASGDEKGWTSFEDTFVYFRLLEDAEPRTIQHALNKIAAQKYAKEKIKASFSVQSLTDITPGPQLYNPIGTNWSYLFLFITGLITLIVLIPATSNYVHLAISQSLERMKEVGVRKVMGAQKEQIFFQFIVESVTIVLIALLLSYMIFEVVRTEYLSQMVETTAIDLSPTLSNFFGFLVFALCVGVAAGVIPALYFTKISPIQALRRKELKTSKRSILRKVVLTTQFMISLGFIMAVVIMLRQYQFSVNYNFGFNQENVLDVELQNMDPHIFKNEFKQLSSVKRISMSSHLLGMGSVQEQYIQTPDRSDSIETFSVSVDEAFIPNLDLELLAGKGFRDNAAENARLIVVNEEFVRRFKLKDPFAAIGSLISLPDGREVRIAGVVKNFHYAGLKKPIQGFFFDYEPGKFRYANVKLATNDVEESRAAMEALWKELGAESDFKAALYSDEIKEAYSFYIMLSKLWGLLGLLAVTVACLGLLGTVAFTTKKRYKEISIRKIMGATSKSLIIMLSKDFVLLMVIASVITIPVMYVLFRHLITNTQHYSREIGLFEILVSLTIMLLLGLTTILSQTWKAANANPVDNLKSE